MGIKFLDKISANKICISKTYTSKRYQISVFFFVMLFQGYKVGLTYANERYNITLIVY